MRYAFACVGISVGGFCLKNRFRRSSHDSGDWRSRFSPASRPAESYTPTAVPRNAHEAKATGSDRAVLFFF